MQTTELTKKERKRLIAKISNASGVAQYALLEKMTDEDVRQASECLEAYKLLKSSNTYNRYCQSQKTQAANDRLKEFMDPQRSEILNAGKWLMSALSKNGSDRQQTLLEKELVHKEDYNGAVTALKATITEQEETTDDITLDAQQTIAILEKRIDALLKQQVKVKDYITNNDGFAKWKIIADTFDLEA